MSSKVQLCNMALVKLARNRVNDIDAPTTNEEKVCNTVFDSLRDEVISTGSWSSIMRRDALVNTGVTPSFGFLYEYQLPTDPYCLHVVNIHEELPGGYEYVIEGDKLLSNKSGVSISYRARITTTDDWDIDLSQAFVYRLTAELAQILTGNESKAEFYHQLYEAKLVKHLASNNQQGSQQYTGSSDLLDVR